MKILFATDNFPPPFSGHSKAVINMASAMKNRGHEITIIAPSPEGFKNHHTDLSEVTDNLEKPVNVNIRVSYLRSLPLFHGDNALKSLAVGKNFIQREMINFKPDIIHFNGWGPLCKTVYKAKPMDSVKTIATCHGVPMHVTSKLFGENVAAPGLEKVIWRMMVNFYGKMDLVLSPSNFVNKKLTAAGLEEKKGIVLSNGIETPIYSHLDDEKRMAILKKYRFPEDKLLVTYIGRLDPEKNIHMLTKTVEYFQYDNNLLFIAAGAGKLKKKLESFAAINRKNFLLHDWLNSEEMVDILGVSDIFFNPSPSESQSITTIEAMASYLPVVATNEGALADLVEENVNGFLFKNNDLGSCTRKLKILLKDPELIIKFGMRSREKSLLHNRNTVMDRLENIYHLQTSRSGLES
ncbi:MAG TPA: glycosyltransferase family 1 protein [Spirochaetes bacterium]|nr:glycosyltransferase family 1 protein [Spirochaetota bacterium]